jgi:hypothetical protein
MGEARPRADLGALNTTYIAIRALAFFSRRYLVEAQAERFATRAAIAAGD